MAYVLHLSAPVRIRSQTCFLMTGGLWTLLHACAVPLSCYVHNVVGWEMLNLTASVYLRSIVGVCFVFVRSCENQVHRPAFSFLEPYGLS